MRLALSAAIIALPILLSSPAEARREAAPKFQNIFAGLFQTQKAVTRKAGRHARTVRNRHFANRGHRHVRAARTRHGNVAVRGGDPRPGAWCAWYVRQQKGISVAYGNLAHGLMRWGRPSGPEVGAIAIWRRRHAGIVVGSCPGGVLVRSGNTWGRGVHGGIGTGCYALSTFRGFRA